MNTPQKLFPDATFPANALQTLASPGFSIHSEEQKAGIKRGLLSGRIQGSLSLLAPVILSNGLGTDSIALSIALYKLGIKPDMILFANVGAERFGTYQYLDIYVRWCAKVGFPQPIVLQYEMKKKPKYNKYCTLAGNCVANKTMPGISFGTKSCSVKHKGAILDAYVSEVYGNTPCYRLVGYDSSPKDCRRFFLAKGKKQKRPDDVFLYPLQILGWNRDMCQAVIEAEGLPQPFKSSCTFCASIKPEELKYQSPEELRLTVLIEANASINNTSVAGLWRKEKMTDYIRSAGLLPEWQIDFIWERFSQERRAIPEDPDNLIEPRLREEISDALFEYLGRQMDAGCPVSPHDSLDDIFARLHVAQPENWKFAAIAPNLNHWDADYYESFDLLPVDATSNIQIHLETAVLG